MSAVGCSCDECHRKVGLLQGFTLAGAPEALLTQLREDLDRHTRRVAGVLSEDPISPETLFEPSDQRPWLQYDPDALLPKPLDAFLLSGQCPMVQWPELPSERKVKLCYVVGCGRSGSTIFAELLSRYPEVVFLNEPRQLWIHADPSSDIWSVAAEGRKGQLTGLSEGVNRLAPHFSRAYGWISQLSGAGDWSSGRPCWILEKFPEHVFKMPPLAMLVERMFGQDSCSFIHISRNGVHVARSIANFGNAGAWYGVKGDWKWKQLALLAMQQNLIPAALEPFLEDKSVDVRLFARGLVEWGVSVKAARQSGLNVLEVRYEDLLEDPEALLSTVEAFLGFEPSDEVRRAASSSLRPNRAAAGFQPHEVGILQALRGSELEELLLDYGAQLLT